jgi:hypothetical protein
MLVNNAKRVYIGAKIIIRSSKTTISEVLILTIYSYLCLDLKCHSSQKPDGKSLLKMQAFMWRLKALKEQLSLQPEKVNKSRKNGG